MNRDDLAPGRTSVLRAAPAIVAVLGTISAFALTRILWPDPAGASGPPADLLPLFVVLAVLVSAMFGLGTAFLAFGLRYLYRFGRGTPLTWAAYLGIAWMLVSWWPHDNLHRVLDHHDYAGLVRIEYGFHVTLMAASVVVAVFFVRTLRARGQVAGRARGGRPGEAAVTAPAAAEAP